MKYFPIYLTLFFAFLLGSHEGFVALWVTPGSEPVRVFPYAVSSLPPADQQRLLKGISIESEADLIALLEDYLS
jgi:hypothetical protein